MASEDDQMVHATATLPVHLPRITISYCTQCRWMLRAAYYAQELFSTFDTAIGEIALHPASQGTFTVTIEYSGSSKRENHNVHAETLWDRKAQGGFPETKELKRRVRDVVEPGRNLGHVDRLKVSQQTVVLPQAAPTPDRADSVVSSLTRYAGSADGSGALATTFEATLVKEDDESNQRQVDCENCQ